MRTRTGTDCTGGRDAGRGLLARFAVSALVAAAAGWLASSSASTPAPGAPAGGQRPTPRLAVIAGKLWCDLGGPGIDPSYGLDPLLAAASPGGIEVVGASHTTGHELVTVLHTVTASCGPVAGFGDDGMATARLPSSSPFAEIDAMVNLPGTKQLLIAGTDGQNEVVGRLLPDGQLDSSFGQAGWARLRPKEKPLLNNIDVPIATSIAVAPSGTIYLARDDSSAHCCVQGFVSALTKSGLPERLFGEDGSVLLPMLGGSYTNQVFVQSSGSEIAAGFVGNFPGEEVVVRLDTRNALDRGFDARARRLIDSLAPIAGQYAPIVFVRNGGAIGLVGDTTSMDPHVVAGGLVFGLTPSGLTDPSFGSGRLLVPDDFGDPPYTWTERGSDGATIVVSAPSMSQLLVVYLRASGRLDPQFGRHGVMVIPIAAAAQHDDDAGVAVSESAGAVTVAVASSQRIETLRVRP